MGVSLLRPALKQQSSDTLPLPDAEVIAIDICICYRGGDGGAGRPFGLKEEGLFGDVGVVSEGIMSLVHLNSAVEYNLKEKMAEQTR